MTARVNPPAGHRFDPFADVRFRVSLFAMSPEDWLVPNPDQSSPDSGTPAEAPAGVPAHPQRLPAGERT